MNNKITTIIFDWGNTLMRDFPEYKGPMASWQKIEVIDCVDEMLSEIKKKYCLCVATNAGDSDTALMVKALERGGIKQHFNHFFSSKDLGFSKPNPMFFSAITNYLYLITSECVMIGNDYEKDIVPAKYVGMKTIFFNENKLTGSFESADFIIVSMREVIRIL